MKLLNIIIGLNNNSIIGSNGVEIDNLSQDTRDDFTQNTAYFAVPGTQVDGHQFIEQAIEKGACAIICQTLPEKINPNVSYVVVDSVLDVMGIMVSNFYENPSEQLEVVAVTGTNGKTTIATVLYQSLLKLGKKAALFSTAGDYINGNKFVSQKKASSSMEIIEFQKSLKMALDAGCQYVCIEATSHALDQQRLIGTRLSGAIFTNLSQDHLDYHKNIEEYAKAKKKLFDMLDNSAFALVNIDDVYGTTIVADTKARIISYGNQDFENPITRDLVFEITGFGLKGTQIKIENREVEIPFIGVFNMYNIIAAYGALTMLEFNEEEVLDTLTSIKGARGRMEIVNGKREGVIGIVDYAHTPDALENVLNTLAEVPHNKIITVVGVGGDRDRTKRPQMAKLAQEKSDYVVFTSDNPRTEAPEQIFNDLLAGCDHQIKNFEKIEDRNLAIKKAVSVSSKNDIILVAGKGHEDYQIIGKEKIHFDDKEVLEKFL